MATTLIGTPVNRVDGRRKVTGAAQYASEFVLAGMVHGFLVDSPFASGRVRAIDCERALGAPGVLAVMTHENRPAVGQMPNSFESGGLPAESRPPLEDDRIYYAGQPVAFVVAETTEQARFAASLLRVTYERNPAVTALDGASAEKHRPADWMHEPLSFERGDVARAFQQAAFQIDETYSTPNEHPCALEPHATIASWSDGVLTVYNSTQWIMGDVTVLTAALNLKLNQIRVTCPFTGGMFGSKGAMGAHTILGALASIELHRPVKTVLTRTQVLSAVGHRSETVQRVALAATNDGLITGLRHDITSHTSINDEFVEFASVASRMLYSIPNYKTSHELVRLNVQKPSWMRAPGEAPGQFALESAIDELAYASGIDPVELRKRNHATVHPANGKPFSSKHLTECYEQGAQRFGWASRDLRPRSMRDGETLVGWGVGTATYPGYTMGAVVKVRLERGREGVRAIVSTAGSDAGTGMYTMLAMTAADELGVPLDAVEVQLGDSELPPCAVAGGSNLTSSTAPATKDACLEIKRELLKIAAETADGFTNAQMREGEFVFRDGAVSHRSDPASSIRYERLLVSAGREYIQAEGKTNPIFGQNQDFCFQSFGAHFVEVRVREEIGRIRVSRIVSVFDCGRILNPKTSRSQFIGGIVFGIGQALLEDLVYDSVRGQAVNADLAGYLVPVHADVPEIDVTWIGEPDLNFNSIGARGIGEIGITGVAAAISNAVFHATGTRVRDLPITPDKLLHNVRLNG